MIHQYAASVTANGIPMDTNGILTPPAWPVDAYDYGHSGIGNQTAFKRYGAKMAYSGQPLY